MPLNKICILSDQSKDEKVGRNNIKYRAVWLLIETWPNVSYRVEEKILQLEMKLCLQIQNNGYFQQYMDWEQAQEVFCSFI